MKISCPNHASDSGEVGTVFNLHCIDNEIETPSNFVTINGEWQKWDWGGRVLWFQIYHRLYHLFNPG